MSKDPYRYFRIEARELVEQLGKTILELEKDATPELTARLLRLAHTLKGAARVVKQGAIADLAHALEDSVAAFRGSAQPPGRDRIDALLALVDQMGARAAALDAPPGRGDDAGLADRAAPAPYAAAADVDEMLEGLSELHAQLAPVRRARDSIERAQRLAEVLHHQLLAPIGADAPRAGAARATAEELRAWIAGLERALSTGLELADRELAQVRRSAEQLRLTPAASMLTALERTARDAAQTLGKRVTFEGRGGDARLGAQVLGAVQNALVQVVRNAVAHGIEPEARRVASGKAAWGRVAVDVRRRGRQIAFVATDDGAGIDLEAVRAAAERRGVAPEVTRALGPDEILRLLLAGGVSTAPAVTEVAGRGVGLDVVRETMQRLGGEVRVTTRPGAGTTVEMVVPTSVAALEALLVQAGGVTAALPLDAVAQSARLEASAVVRTAEGESVPHGEGMLPFSTLARVLDAGAASHEPRAWSAVVVRGDGGSAAVIGVDALLGTRAVVVRPVPALAPAADVVAGVTVDADGDPMLVLDPDAVVRAARRPLARAASVARAPRPSPVLVVDDSLTTRMLERSILEAAGYDVHLAVSGEEGLSMARSATYSLFLVDVEMPGMDGFTFVERTRAEAALRAVPAILVSSRSSAEDRRRGLEVGAVDYVVKSEFDQAALLARIRECVG
jgi:two-component system chemotaxis sensor kinase CheA